jgi:hypothetical protein
MMKRYLMLISLGLNACVETGYEPVRLDAHYGKSVQSISQAQQLNPKAAVHPSPKAPKKLDGLAGQAVIQTYRATFGQVPITQPVIVNVNGTNKGP